MNIQEQLMSLVEQSTAHGDSWIPNHIRSKAREEFLQLGFPTVKHEEWKFTNVIPVLKGEMMTVKIKDGRGRVEGVAKDGQGVGR